MVSPVHMVFNLALLFRVTAGSATRFMVIAEVEVAVHEKVEAV